MGVVNTSKPTLGEDPPTKELPMSKTKYNKKATSNRKRATLDHPDKEIKETASLSLTDPLPQNFTLRRQLAKQNIWNHRNKQKESCKMGTQRKNPQLKGMEDSPVKELNEMKPRKPSDIEFK